MVFSSYVHWVVCGATGLHSAYDAILILGTKEVAKEETTLLRKPTVRHICCAVLLPATSKTIRCTNCEGHRHTLRSLSCRVETPSAVEKTAPDSHVNYRFLSTPEKTVRLKRIHSELRCMHLKKERLKTKLEKVVEEEGVVVDSEMHADLCNIMTTNETEMKKTYPEESFQHIFWKQQQQAAILKNACSMRWHPLIIKWCLYLRHISGRAYETI